MDERSNGIEQRLESPVLVAALLVIPVIVTEGSDYGEPWQTVGVVLNLTTWLVFPGEATVI
jgi:hypothetical protein